MNNNQMNFDPITGQPINNQDNITTPTQLSDLGNVTSTPIDNLEPQVEQSVIPTNNSIDTQQQLQSIPNVEQSTQDFINNVQATNNEKKEEKKDGPNIWFIAILFVIIFAAILFLFPYLLKTL